MMGFHLSCAAAFGASLTLSDNGLNAGYMTLSWTEAPGNTFELKENAPEGWVTLYRGSDRASTLSGLADGSYEFALYADGVQVGEPLTVTVAHHSLGRAFSFFAVGALMFITLLAFLMTQSRTDEGQYGA